jgi:hypothetical protein
VLLASVRPRSVAVSFDFLVLDEVAGSEAGLFDTTTALLLLRGPGEFSSVGVPSGEILKCLSAQNLTRLVSERHSNRSRFLISSSANRTIIFRFAWQ